MIGDVHILENQSFSDHFPVTLKWTVKANDLESKIVRDTSFLRNCSIVEKYLSALSHELCNVFSAHSGCANSCFSAFHHIFLTVTEQYAPLKRITPHNRNSTPKWFDNKIKNMRTQRNLIHRKWKADKSNGSLSKKFTDIRLQLEKSIKTAKKVYYRNMFEKCIGDSRQTFKLLNELSGKHLVNNAVPKLSSCMSDTAPNSSNFQVAEKFNEFFASIGKNIQRSIPSEAVTPLTDVNMTLRVYPVSDTEISEIIDSLPDKSSSGEDEISNIVVKTTKSVVTKYLTSLINQSFREGVFPTELKKAKVIPLHKEGSRLEENNYRPISLLNVWSKIYERAMFSRIYEYLEHFNLLYRKQFGFRKKHSTIDALTELTERIRVSQFKVVNFFLDLQKAFDTLDHQILLRKLESYGIRHKCLEWCKSYLSNRTQRVFVAGVTSTSLNITCGVPQGSILGPLLFLIYINDLPRVCNQLSVHLFADDTNLCSLGCSRIAIQDDLDSVAAWLNANKLKLNMLKTAQLNLKTSASSERFHITSEEIKLEPSCKYLGIIVDSKLLFSSHIDLVIGRLSRQCGIISKLRHFAPRYQLIEYYKSIICPIIQYGILVYGCSSFTSLAPIHLLQKKILKLIYFKSRFDQSEDLFCANKILTVFELHVYELLKFVLKSINSFHAEDYLNSMFQFERHFLTTRRAKHMLLKVPLCRSKLEQNSISRRASTLFNVLKIQGLLPDSIGSSTYSQISMTYHNLKESYILGNEELIRKVFFC